jgi:hypothetical protein
MNEWVDVRVHLRAAAAAVLFYEDRSARLVALGEAVTPTLPRNQFFL